MSTSTGRGRRRRRTSSSSGRTRDRKSAPRISTGRKIPPFWPNTPRRSPRSSCSRSSRSPTAGRRRRRPTSTTAASSTRFINPSKNDVKFRTRGVLPGFGLSMGYTLLYLSVLVLIPLSALFLKASALGPTEFIRVVTHPRALAAYKLTFGASAVAAFLNAFMGLLLAWVLVRYRFF